MSKKVIKLSATWCGPCKQYAPTFDSLTPAMEDAGWEVTSLDVDAEEGKDVATKYGVRGVPTTVVLEDGKEDIVQSGVLAESQLKELLGID